MAGSATRNKFWIRIFRGSVAILVLLAIVYTTFKTSNQLHASNFSFSSVRWRWLVAAIFAYIVTMTLSWMFWHQVLLALGQRAAKRRTLLAFFASQLGKYIPGKAMVVVIRTDMIRGLKFHDEPPVNTSQHDDIQPGRAGDTIYSDSQLQKLQTSPTSPTSQIVQTGPAAASVFVETLTWLFVGSAIGCLLLMIQFREQKLMLVAATLMTITAGGLTSPPVFRRIAHRLGIARGITNGKSADELLAGLSWTTMGFGWFVMSIGWCLNGLSLWLVLYGMGSTGITFQDFPLTLACVCLATVAGFVSLLPGGIGVRELVMIPLLGARFGSVTAVIAAVLIRLVWLTAELLTSAIIYVWLSFNKPS